MLKDETSFYKVCFDSMQMGILVFNKSKKIVLLNSPLTYLFGYSNDELIGKNVEKLFKKVNLFRNFINDSQKDKFKHPQEIIGIQKNGLEIPLELIFGEIIYKNKSYYKIFISDITLRKNKENKISNLTLELEKEVELRNQELEKVVDKLKISFNSEKGLKQIKNELSTIESQLQTSKSTRERKGVNLVKSKNLKEYIEGFSHGKEVYKYKKNETIYCTGNLSNHIFLIKKGEVKTYKIDEHGKELITGYYTNNQYFGYLSFVKHTSHFENSKAITNLQLFKINKDEIAQIVNSNPKIVYEFINILANDLVEIKEKLLFLAYASVRKKTARIILKLSKKHMLNSEGEIKITRINLANMIGVAKETLIRTLHDFKEEKLIKLNKKTIIILNELELYKIQ